MPTPPTNFGTTVAWEGFTWTFQSPVTWGNFINGQPWVYCQQGQVITLQSIEPAPQAIPWSQITAKTGAAGTVLTLQQMAEQGVPEWGEGTQTATGNTALAWGLMPTANIAAGGTWAMFVNGQIINPANFGRFKIADVLSTIQSSDVNDASTNPTTSNNPSSWVVSNPESSSGVYQGTFKIIDSRKDRFSSTASLSGNNLAATTYFLSFTSPGKTLTSGDMLISYNTRVYNGDLLANRGGYPPAFVGINALSLSNINRTGILTVLPYIPDSLEFRPPLSWNYAYGSRPTGFTLPDVSGKTAAFLSLPTKNLFGVTLDQPAGSIFSSIDTSVPGGSTNGAGLFCPSIANQLNNNLIPPFSAYNNNVTPANTISRLFPIWNSLGIEPENNSSGATFHSFLTNLTTFNELPHSMACDVPITHAIGIFANWYDDYTRYRCLLKTIQYGIDLYGMVKSNQFTRGYGESPIIKATSTDPRGLIILTGWLLGNSAMMNIDSVNESEGLTLYNYVVGNTATSVYALHRESLTKMNSMFRFYEGNARRLAGTFGDPTIPKGLAYTDPGTTHETGIGFALKHTLGPNNSYGIPVALAGSTSNISLSPQYNTTAVSYNHSPSITNLNSTYTHAMIGATMFTGATLTGITTNPAATGGDYPMPKMTDGNMMWFKSDRKVLKNKSTIKLIGCKVRIVSGAGSGPQTYSIVAVREIRADGTLNFPPTTTYHYDDTSFTTTNNTAAFSGTKKILFILDKDWQNGTPDSTSRFIIYPFDANDIGKVVHGGGEAIAYSDPTNTGHLANMNSSFGSLGSISNSKETGFVTAAASEKVVYSANIFMYGLLYQLGKRYPSSGILTNEITTDYMDYLLAPFGTEPQSALYLLSSSLVTDLISSSGTIVGTNLSFLPISAMARRNMYGGLLRSLWERELPRERG